MVDRIVAPAKGLLVGDRGVRAAGLGRELAATVAERLMAVDPLGSHVRDELGLQPGRLARPLQAAVVSAVSFAVGAALRVTVGGALAMGLTALIGQLVGATGL